MRRVAKTPDFASKGPDSTISTFSQASDFKRDLETNRQILHEKDDYPFHGSMAAVDPITEQ
jgi:hypothetical protein